jgi:multidrug efflux pump subunit AcrA (membrane-fusion protein)
MTRTTKSIFIIGLVALAGLGIFRAAQVISGKKSEGLNPRSKSAVPLVEVAPAIQGLVEEKIFRAGDIVPETQVTIYSKVQGWVEKINVREGDLVQTGQILVTLDAREAQAAVAQSRANLEAATARLRQVRATAEEAVQSQLQQARANVELAESDLRRAQELYQKNFIARAQLDEARTRYNVAKANYDLALNNIRQRTWENEIALAEAQVRQAMANLQLSEAQLANLIIRSPMDGGVTKRYVDPGTMVKDTTPILTLMDMRELKMVVSVIEREFVRLKVGQPVKVTVTVFPNRIFSGRISIITPALELQSRTAEIQIAIPNPGLVLKPGMFGRAEILLRSNPQATLIPIQALIAEENRDVVFVLKDGKAFRREVEKGLVKDTSVEILKGISPGEEVITAGQSTLRDGVPVRLTLRGEKG